MMKKPKKPEKWEESPLVASKDFGAEFEDLDEEIIELDDEIIELPAEGIEEEESPFDVEILDEDRQLDLKDGEDKAESDEEFLLESDLLKELPFFQDQAAEPEPAQSKEGAEEQPEEPAPELLADTGEEAREESAHEAELSIPEEAGAAAFSQLVEAPAASAVSLDDFVAQIESRLLDTVREMVESRLPEIVRMVLREEIERLKADEESEE